MQVTPKPEDVPGYESDSGWLVPTKERALTKLLRDTPAPREYGALDQVRVDMRSGPAMLMYCVCISLFTYGLATTNWGTLIVAIAILVFFGRGFVGSVRAARHGVLGIARITELQHDVGRNQGVNEGTSVDGRMMNVGYDLPMVRALLADVGAAELQVIYDPRAARPVANALAYRRPEGT